MLNANYHLNHSIHILNITQWRTMQMLTMLRILYWACLKQMHIVLHMSKEKKVFKRCCSNENPLNFITLTRPEQKRAVSITLRHTKHDMLLKFNGVYFAQCTIPFILSLLQVQGNNCICTFFANLRLLCGMRLSWIDAVFLIFYFLHSANINKNPNENCEL